MIPQNITRKHILQALSEIDRQGVPAGRSAKKYGLEHDGRLYPPKLVISLAALHAQGAELIPSTFSGGQESNEFLRRRGFRIVKTCQQDRAEETLRPTMESPSERQMIHTGERCAACKVRVRQLLEKLYGEIKERHSLGLGSMPEDYAGTPYHDFLQHIYADLVAHRGFANFVRARQLPPCDYFVPDPGFIVEFDESQHFTAPRSIALQWYPSSLSLGFDRQCWQVLCTKIAAHDPDPPFRDEQRAWYDTLRDFAPACLELRPTVRLYAGHDQWCRLNPDRPADLALFRQLIEGQDRQKTIKVRAGSDASIARIIIKREWPGDAREARTLLEAVANQWPAGHQVNFLMTCGGYIQFPLEEAVSLETLRGDGANALTLILERAVQVAYELVSADLRIRLREHARYITLGIDTQKNAISTTQNRILEPHAETVIVLDLETGKHHATAKSYPTSAQEQGLIRNRDLGSHFLHLDDGNCVMVLGCHDLSVWNPRSINARGWRAQVNAEFRNIAHEKQPTIVLHHPHTADSKMTWRAAWTSLERDFPSVKQYAGAGRYWHQDDPRSSLDETLALTKKGPSLDFIIE